MAEKRRASPREPTTPSKPTATDAPRVTLRVEEPGGFIVTETAARLDAQGRAVPVTATTAAGVPPLPPLPDDPEPDDDAPPTPRTPTTPTPPSKRRRAGTHPRIPADAGLKLRELAAAIANRMGEHEQDARAPSLGETVRLLLLHIGELRTPKDELEALRQQALAGLLRQRGRGGGRA